MRHALLIAAPTDGDPRQAAPRRSAVEFAAFPPRTTWSPPRSSPADGENAANASRLHSPRNALARWHRHPAGNTNADRSITRAWKSVSEIANPISLITRNESIDQTDRSVVTHMLVATFINRYGSATCRTSTSPPPLALTLRPRRRILPVEFVDLLLLSSPPAHYRPVDRRPPHHDSRSARSRHSATTGPRYARTTPPPRTPRHGLAPSMASPHRPLPSATTSNHPYSHRRRSTEARQDWLRLRQAANTAPPPTSASPVRPGTAPFAAADAGLGDIICRLPEASSAPRHQPDNRHTIQHHSRPCPPPLLNDHSNHAPHPPRSRR